MSVLVVGQPTNARKLCIAVDNSISIYLGLISRKCRHVILYETVRRRVAHFRKYYHHSQVVAIFKKKFGYQVNSFIGKPIIMNITPRIFIDLTDFETNAVWFNAFTGIQRVQLCLTRHLVKNCNAIPFSMFDYRFRDLSEDLASDDDPTKINLLLRAYHSSLIDQKKLFDRTAIGAKAFAILRRLQRYVFTRYAVRSAAHNIKHGDILLAAGAFWQSPHMLDIYQDASLRGVRVVGMCHDIFSILDWRGPKKGGDRMKRFLEMQKELLSISAYTISQIERAKQLGVLNSSVPHARVVPLAHEFPGYSRNDIVPLTERLQLALKGRRFTLFVSRFEPRKNHLWAAENWERISKSKPHFPVLVFAGPLNDFPTEKFNSIVCIDKPNDQEMAALYSNSLFTIFPSLEEGWGLPPGEALWFGKTCAASNSSSIAEVGGDLFSYFSPTDEASFVQAVDKLMDDDIRTNLEQNIAAQPLRTWRDFCESVEMALINNPTSTLAAVSRP